MIISENCGLSASSWLCKKKASSCMHCSKNSRHLILIDPNFYAFAWGRHLLLKESQTSFLQISLKWFSVRRNLLCFAVQKFNERRRHDLFRGIYAFFKVKCFPLSFKANLNLDYFPFHPLEGSIIWKLKKIVFKCILVLDRKKKIRKLLLTGVPQKWLQRRMVSVD